MNPSAPSYLNGAESLVVDPNNGNDPRNILQKLFIPGVQTTKVLRREGAGHRELEGGEKRAKKWKRIDIFALCNRNGRTRQRHLAYIERDAKLTGAAPIKTKQMIDTMKCIEASLKN